MKESLRLLSEVRLLPCEVKPFFSARAVEDMCGFVFFAGGKKIAGSESITPPWGFDLFLRKNAELRRNR